MTSNFCDRYYIFLFIFLWELFNGQYKRTNKIPFKISKICRFSPDFRFLYFRLPKEYTSDVNYINIFYSGFTNLKTDLNFFILHMCSELWKFKFGVREPIFVDFMAIFVEIRLSKENQFSSFFPRYLYFWTLRNKIWHPWILNEFLIKQLRHPKRGFKSF